MEEGSGKTMSDAEAGEGREVSQRFADVEDELRQGDNLGALMAEQWRGMAGMAGMFVATIALAMYIRPYYDVGELHAFGASGATQVRWVLMELIAIFAFTALIIFLARWGKQYIIKYGMYVVLTLALMYTMVPLAHMLVLDFDTDPFVVESTEERNGVMLGTWGDDGFVLYNISAGNVNTSVDITAWDATNGYAEPVWTNTHAHQVNDVNSPVSMTSSAEHLTFASGAYAWSVDINSGELIESFACYTWDNGEPVPLDNMFGGCAIAVSTGDAIYLANAFDELIRYRTFDESPGVLTQEARWRIPGFLTGDGVVKSHLLDADEWSLTTAAQSASVLLETTSPSLGLGLGGLNNATYLTQHVPAGNGSFTSADIGWSPFLGQTIEKAKSQPDTRHQRLILLGESTGAITGVEWNGSMDGDGFVKITGRKKELMKTSGGKYIAPAKLEARVKNMTIVQECVTVADTRNYVTALIAVDPEELAEWAEQTGNAADPNSDAVRAAIQAHVDEVNGGLARYETIKYFNVVPPMTVEDGLLTASLKVKRKVVYDRYSAEIDAMYAKQKPA